MRKTYALNSLAAAIVVACSSMSANAQYGCTINNSSSENVNTPDGLYSLIVNAGSTCNPYNFSFRVGDLVTGEGSLPLYADAPANSYVMVDGWVYGYLQNAPVAFTYFNVADYGDFVSLAKSNAVSPVIANPPVATPPSGEQYLVMYTTRPNGYAISSNGVLQTTVDHYEGNLFIDANVSRSNALNVGGVANVAGNLVTKTTSGANLVSDPYYNRSILVGGTGQLNVGRNLMSFIYENPTVRRLQGGANIDISNSGRVTVADSLYVYSASGQTGLRMTGGSISAEDTIILNTRVRNLNGGAVDTNNYAASGISNNAGVIDFSSLLLLTQGFHGITQQGGASSIQAGDFVLDTTLRDASDSDAWTNTATGYQIFGGVGAFGNTRITSYGDAIVLAGNGAALSLGDSRYAQTSALTVDAGTALLNLGPSSQVTSLGNSAIAVADGVNGDIRLNAGAVLSAGAGQPVIRDGSGATRVTLYDGASFNGDLALAGGNDAVTVMAATLAGRVWMDDGDDTASLQGASTGGGRVLDVAGLLRLDGGDGIDTFNASGLSFSAYSAINDNAAYGMNLVDWEMANLTAGSRMALTDVFSLGGTDGLLSIDGRSSVVLRDVTGIDTNGVDREIHASVNNAGVMDVRYASVPAANSLTVDGYYRGLDGALMVDTLIEAGMPVADRLYIDGGRADGKTQVVVDSKAGLGAATTGLGILVVGALNGASTSADAFVLNGGPIEVGPYRYSLTRRNNESWYLTTQYVPPVVPDPDPLPPLNPEELPPEETEALPPATPGDNSPDVPNIPGSPEVPGTPDADIPWYNPDTSLIPAIPSLLQMLGANSMDSWRERVGERAYQQQEDNTAWVRVTHQEGKEDDRVTHSDGQGSQMFEPRFKYRNNLLQVGVDFYQHYEGEQLRRAFGTYFAVGRATADVAHAAVVAQHLLEDAGDIHLNAAFLGIYGTFIGENGVYLDAVAQYGDHTVDVYGIRSGDKRRLSSKAGEVTASLELGRSFAVSEHWTLTPQLHGRWQQMRIDRMAIADAEHLYGHYVFDAADSLMGRIGLAARYQSLDNVAFWGRLDVEHEFKGKNTVVYRNLRPNGMDPRFTSSIAGTHYGIVLGGDVRLGKQVNLFGSGGYEQASGNSKSHGWNARLGLRLNW